MLTISNYHYIRQNYDAKYPSIFGVTPEIFKKQLILLKNDGEFISPTELINSGEEILQSNENFYFVTFDDGLKEQLQWALPILEDLNIPAVFFANSINHSEKKITTVHKIHLLRSIIAPNELLSTLHNQSHSIRLNDVDYEKGQKIYIYDDRDSAALKYFLNYKLDFKIQEEIINIIFNNYFDENTILNELYMDEKQLIDLSQKGYLGSHTHSHFPIGLLQEEAIYSELARSKQFFENLTNTKIEMVAYPYGTPEACTEQVATIAKQVGYKYGFTTTRGTNTHSNNRLLLNRFDCNDLLGGKNYK